MPITIRETVEPYSRSTTSFGTGSGGSILIESDAYRLLKQEAERYICGEVRGRSFLIAGHRGSGKTTLVLHVCQTLRDHSPLPHRRILPVFLHGPNLLPDRSRTVPGGAPEARQETEDEDGPGNGSGAPHDGDDTLAAGDETPGQGEETPAASGAPERPPPGPLVQDETENALIQITLELYRALAHEVTARFRRAVLAGKPITFGSSSPRNPWMRVPRRALGGPPLPAPAWIDPELIELASQLELELDRCPEPARLRQIWDQAGFLSSGVLFPLMPQVLAERPDQGLRELVALASACQMYRRISGSFTSEEERKDELKRAAEASLAASSQGKDILSPLAALLTGGLVGTGAFAAGGASGPLAALTGVIAALGAAAAFKVSASRSRQRTVTEDSKFVRDLTVATLDREIPVLIERCLDAGLVPLFIVDELDKIEDTSERITPLVRRLKKLVAERAFFCFLSDRSYFEEMRQRTRTQAYPIEYTYFTHDLFIVFSHRDLHQFLLRIVALSKPGPQATGGPPAPSSSSGDNPGPTPTWTASSEEVEDLRILPYVLLHQAKMHVIDLRRELTRLRGEDGTVLLGSGQWRSRANLCDLMIQVAVEIVLEGEELSERLRREPRFRRLAHDALYYPSRLWEDGEYDLDLSDQAEEAFGRWLVGRMGRDESSSTKKTPREDPDRNPKMLATDDRHLLFERVRELARLLACSPVDNDPEKRGVFKTAFLAWEDHPAAASIPPDRRLTWATAESHAQRVLPLLVPKAGYGEGNEAEAGGESHQYFWRLDYSGLKLETAVEAVARGAGIEPVTEPEVDPFAEVDRLRAFAEVVTGMGGEPASRPDGMPWLSFTLLTSELRILGVSPSWVETERALERLASLRSGDQAPDLAELDSQGHQDIQTVHDFHDMLVREHRTLALALACGAILGRACRADAFGERLLAGLRAISRMYRFEARPADQKAADLHHLAAELKDEGSLSEDLRPPEELGTLEAEPWRRWMTDVSVATEKALPKGFIEERMRQAWTEWSERLPAYAAKGALRFDPGLPEIWCAAASSPPANLLVPDLSAMKLGDWSRVFFEAAFDWSQRTDTFAAWAAVWAVHALGFRLSPQELLALAERGGWLEAYSERQITQVPIPFGDWKTLAFSVFRNWEPRTHALLICRDQNSLTQGWMPAHKGGVLALTREQLWRSGLVGRSGKAPPLLAALRLDLVAMELAPDERSKSAEAAVKRAPRRREELKTPLGAQLPPSTLGRLAQLLARWGPPPAIVYLAADSSLRMPTDHPTILAPSDADDLLSQAPPPPSAAS